MPFGMTAGNTALLIFLTAALTGAQPKSPGNLVIAQQGYLFAGGTYSDGKNARILSGQLYAEFQIPARRTHPWPIIMIHGGSQTGTNFTGTADGREGWSSCPLVILDQREHGWQKLRDVWHCPLS